MLPATGPACHQTRSIHHGHYRGVHQGPCSFSIILLRCNTNLRIKLAIPRSEEHTSELQSLMRISYAVFCLKKKKTNKQNMRTQHIYNTHNTNNKTIQDQPLYTDNDQS